MFTCLWGGRLRFDGTCPWWHHAVDSVVRSAWSEAAHTSGLRPAAHLYFARCICRGPSAPHLDWESYDIVSIAPLPIIDLAEWVSHSEAGQWHILAITERKARGCHSDGTMVATVARSRTLRRLQRSLLPVSSGCSQACLPLKATIDLLSSLWRDCSPI